MSAPDGMNLQQAIDAVEAVQRSFRGAEYAHQALSVLRNLEATESALRDRARQAEAALARIEAACAAAEARRADLVAQTQEQVRALIRAAEAEGDAIVQAARDRALEVEVERSSAQQALEVLVAQAVGVHDSRREAEARLAELQPLVERAERLALALGQAA